MTDEAMSPLRRRMIEDMTIRQLAPKTQQGYIRVIKDFAAFLGRSPDTASFEDVRRFQLHLAANGGHIPIVNHNVAALRFFFRITLRRSDIIEHTTFLHEPRKLPVVLSSEEVARLLDAAPGLKYKAALSVAYGAGLRATEVTSLKVGDIDSKRMVIRVEQGKGRKDRYVMLSPHLLELLRAWWRAERPQGWLFPGRDRVQPMLPHGSPWRSCRALRGLRLYDHCWLVGAVDKRLREEFGKLQVEINGEKSRTVDLERGECFGFLGFEFRYLRGLSGAMRPHYTPKLKKRTALVRALKEVFRRHRSQPIERLINLINPVLRGWVNYFAVGHSSECFSFIKDWVEKKVRRHLAKGFGWERWNRRWLYDTLGLFNAYRVRRAGPKVAPAG
jgi:hypothetical protein